MGNPVSTLNAGFPQAPFVDSATGDIALVWRSFLISLYARTGGGVGTSTAALTAALAAEVTNRTNADTALAGTVANEAQARAGGDAVLSARIDLVPTPVGGMALDLLRVNARAAAYEVRTPAQTLGDIGAQPIKGVIDHSDAPAGQIGQYISSTVLAAAAVALVNNVAANVTLISLPAGDWDVWGIVNYLPAATTTMAALAAAISSVSATFPVAPANGTYQGLTLGFTDGAQQYLSAGQIRLSLGVATPVYLVGQATFGTSTMKAFGFIGARRRR